MGEIKSTVLFHCNGVITEDRFQKMTILQWIYQYNIIKKKTTEEKKYQRELIKSVAGKLIEIYENISLGNTEFLSFFIDGSKFKEYEKIKEEKKTSKEDQKNGKPTLEEEWEMLSDLDVSPEVIEVSIQKSERQSENLKTIPKKFIGIQKK